MPPRYRNRGAPTIAGALHHLAEPLKIHGDRGGLVAGQVSFERARPDARALGPELRWPPMSTIGLVSNDDAKPDEDIGLHPFGYVRWGLGR